MKRKRPHNDKAPVGRGERPTEPAERDLWHHVAKTVNPLRAKQRVPATTTVSKPIQEDVRSATPQPSTRSQDVAKPSKKADRRSVSPEKQTKTPPPQPLNRRQLRKLSSLRTTIDARLDLHGMRQQEAHDALRAFIVRSSAAGHRTVLVITGKGRSATARAEVPDIVSERQEQGVLRRRVPAWIHSDPAIAPYVIALTEATQRHGGSGAFYVTLRTKAVRQ